MATEKTMAIVVKTKDQASKPLATISKKMGDLAKVGGAVAAGLGIATVALTAITKQVEKYAQQDQAIDAVNNALLKHGTNWEDLRIKMTEASNGMITEMDLLNKTGMGTTLGIDPDALVGMLEIARAASKGMGIEMSHAFDSIVTGTARQSRLLLDNIGIIVSVEDANKKYADSIGKTVKQLTEQEKKLAFQNEVLEQGKVIIESFGGNTETVYESIQRMTTSISDIAINAIGIANSLLPVGDTFQFWADTATNASNAVRELKTNLNRMDDDFIKAEKKKADAAEAAADASVIRLNAEVDLERVRNKTVSTSQDVIDKQIEIGTRERFLATKREEELVAIALLNGATKEYHDQTGTALEKLAKQRAELNKTVIDDDTDDTTKTGSSVSKTDQDLWRGIDQKQFELSPEARLAWMTAKEETIAWGDELNAERATQAEQFVQDRLEWQRTEMDVVREHQAQMEQIQQEGLQKEADWAAIKKGIWLEEINAQSNLLNMKAQIGKGYIQALGMNQKDQAKILGPLEWVLGAKDIAASLTNLAAHNYGDAAAFATSGAAHFDAARSFAKVGGGGGGSKKDASTGGGGTGTDVPGEGAAADTSPLKGNIVLNVPDGLVNSREISKEIAEGILTNIGGGARDMDWDVSFGEPGQ